MPGNTDGSITIDTELDNKGFEKSSDKLLTAIKNLTENANRFGNDIGRSFQRANTVAQQFGSDISNALKSSEFDKEISAAGRSCSTLSTQLQRIADAARAGLNTDSQVVRFQMAIEKARDSIVQMQSQLTSLASQQVSTAEYEELAAATKKAEQALFNLYERRDIMQQMGVKENSKEWQRLAILIENAEYKLNNYERTMTGMQANGTAFKSCADTAQYQQTAAQLAQMSEKLKEYETMAAKFDTISQPAARSKQSLKNVDAELKQKPKDTEKASSGFQRFGSALKSVASTALRTAGTIAKLSLKAVASGAKAVSNGFQNAAKGIKSFITRTKSASASSKGLVKQLTSLKTMLLSKVKAAIISSIWNGAKESLQELAKFSSSFDKSMSGIKNSAKELSANLGVSLGELIKTVEPALTSLINMLSEAVTSLNAFFAMMQGKTTMTAAKKQTDSYAKSLDNAAESAKDVANATLGIDELNVINDNSSNNKSNASASGAQPFEEVPIDSVLPEEIKDFWDEIKAAIEGGDWSGLGEKIAEGLNAGLQAVDAWINGVLRPEGVKWSSQIAEILNGLVSGFDWTLLGKTVADGINAIADIINTFLTTFNFENLGVGIGETINGLFDNIEWDLLGQTFANQWNALIDFIYGIVTTVDWSNIGDSFADFFNNFFFTVDWNKAVDTITTGLNGITTAVQHFMEGVNWESIGNVIGTAFNKLATGINWNDLSTAIATGLNDIAATVNGFTSAVQWDDIGKQFSDGVNTLVDGIQWDYIGETLSNGFNDIVSIINSFVSGVEWDNLGTQLADGVNTIVGTVDWDKAGETVSTGINGITDLINSFTADIKWDDLGTSVADGFNSIFATVNWDDIAEMINNAVDGLFDLVNGFLEDLRWDDIGGTIGTCLNNLQFDDMLSDIGTTISDLVLSAYDLLIGFLEDTDWGDLTDKIFNGLIGLIQNIKYGDIVAKACEFLGAAIGATVSVIATLALDIWDLLKSAWESVKTYFGDYIDSFGGDIIAGMCAGINNALLGISKWIEDNILTPIWDGICKAFGIHSPSTKMMEIGDNLIAGLLSGITDAWNSITSFFSTTVDSIKNTLSGAWDSVKTTASTKWNNIKTTVSGLWEGLKTDLGKTNWSDTGSNLVAGLKAGIKNAWEGLKTTVSNLAAGLTSTVQKIFGEHSPSTVWAKIGEYLDEGLKNGLLNGQKGVLSTVSGMAHGITDSMDLNGIVLGAESGLSRLASRMLTLNSIYNQRGKSFSIPEMARGTVIPARTAVSSDSATGLGYTSSDGQAYLNKIIELLQAIVDKNGDVYLDKDKIGRILREWEANQGKSVSKGVFAYGY